MGDLTFIEDGNPITLTNGYINFLKCKRVAEVIKQIQRFQKRPYNLKKIQVVADLLTNQKMYNDEECFKISLIIEPRKSVS